MAAIASLDPRVNRLPAVVESDGVYRKAPLDQFGTYEVFVQPKAGKPFQHEGIVHAPNLELAFVLAKEAFTRRFLCVSIFVVDTREVFVSPMTDGNENVYDRIADAAPAHTTHAFEIFHLPKRGKQHVHVGQVQAATAVEAMQVAKQQLRGDKVVYNVWAVATAAIRFTQPDEQDMWLTLPDKKFRDAADYKAGDKLKFFLEKNP
jgi:ring-1,2-phenylacetyl-CoA epoxidase subunit PaaB